MEHLSSTLLELWLYNLNTDWCVEIDIFVANWHFIAAML